MTFVSRCKHLQGMVEAGVIQGCIFGEERSNSCDYSCCKGSPELKVDPDLRRRNHGITIVML
jgi:hypothetical protein